MGSVHINQPGTCYVRRIGNCPTCRQRRRVAGFDQLWYGPTWTCLGCGDSWSDGEMLPRPFARGWREKAIARAQGWWAEAVRFLGPEHRAFLRRERQASS